MRHFDNFDMVINRSGDTNINFIVEEKTRDQTNNYEPTHQPKLIVVLWKPFITKPLYLLVRLTTYGSDSSLVT
jgi:hypothetical protein